MLRVRTKPREGRARARSSTLGPRAAPRYLARMTEARRPPSRRLRALAAFTGVLACGACARSPESWAAQFASNDPYERELAAAALGHLPPERARWTMHNLLRRLADPDAQVRERLLTAIDAQLAYAPLAFARGFATADCGDPDLARRMDELARARVSVLAPAALALFDEEVDAASSAQFDRLFFQLLDADPACLDAALAAEGSARSERARAVHARWRTARGTR